MPIMPPSTKEWFRFEAANDEEASDLGWTYANGMPRAETVADLAPLHQLVYVSSSRSNWTEAELDRLVTRVRIHNGTRGITGMLLYIGGSFIQALEGPAAQISDAMDRIQADKRHWHVQRIVDRRIVLRDFADNSMGFRHCRPVELAMAGAFDLSHAGLATFLGAGEGIAVGVLHRFYDWTT
jgi:Sensors of blue-light using FAD